MARLESIAVRPKVRPENPHAVDEAGGAGSGAPESRSSAGGLLRRVLVPAVGVGDRQLRAADRARGGDVAGRRPSRTRPARWSRSSRSRRRPPWWGRRWRAARWPAAARMRPPPRQRARRGRSGRGFFMVILQAGPGHDTGKASGSGTGPEVHALHAREAGMGSDDGHAGPTAGRHRWWLCKPPGSRPASMLIAPEMELTGRSEVITL